MSIPNIIPEHDILKRLWIGSCTVYEYQPVTDPITHQTTHNLVAVVTDEPCRLSYDNDAVTNINSGAAVVSQIIKLFISPDITIKSGSVIDITQHGKTHRYKRGSEPSVYTNHQEIILQIDEGG